MGLLPSQKRAARVAILRLGEPAEISAPTGGVQNAYGKQSGGSFSPLTTETVVRTYRSGSDPGQSRTTGGRYRSEAPVLLFTDDSVVEEGHRVDYLGTTYEVDTLTRFPTHLEADTTVVN